MEVVIIGAGTIGYSIAKTLSKNHVVTVIEDDEERYEYIVENLDVGTLNANGANPKVLKGVIKPDTDLFLAVTAYDEVNIFACMVAKQIKKDIVTVARVRNSDYLDPTTLKGFMAVDHAISPEHLIADMMFRVVTTENMVGYDSLRPIGAELARFAVRESARYMTAIPFKDLLLPPDCKIVVIHRGEDIIMPNETDFLVVGDEVTVVGKSNGIIEFDRMLGRIRRPKDFIIVGGGMVGETLARMLEKEKASVKLIEKDERRCERLSKRLDRTTIINGDGSDPAVLQNENVNMVDALISVRDDEEANLLACLIGRHLGAPKVVSLYTRRDYEDVFCMKEIDAAFGFYDVVTNEILHLTAPEFKVMLSLNSSTEEFFSVKVTEGSKVKDRAMADIDLPERSIIAMIQREGETFIPVAQTVLKEGDLVLVYAVIADIPRLERLFRAHIPVGP